MAFRSRRPFGLERIQQVVVVPVVGCCDQNCINAFPLEQFAMVRVASGAAPGVFQPQIPIHTVDVTNGGPVHALFLENVHMMPAHAARSDDPHNNPVVRAEDLGAERRVGQHAQSHGRAATQEIPARDSVVWRHAPPAFCWGDFMREHEQCPAGQFDSPQRRNEPASHTDIN
jgi:hypothetical protein